MPRDKADFCHGEPQVRSDKLPHPPVGEVLLGGLFDADVEPLARHLDLFFFCSGDHSDTQVHTWSLPPAAYLTIALAKSEKCYIVAL